MLESTLNFSAAHKTRKGSRTHERILQSAIHCLADLGYEKTTFQAIADHCGISQPLVVHYFKRKENLFPSVIEYLGRRTRTILATELGQGLRPSARLREFIRVSLGYARKEPEPAKVFLTLHFLAAFDERYRRTNALIKQVVVHELVEILVEGVRLGEFDVEEITLTARLICNYLVGVRMSLLNEAPTVPDEAISRAMESHCLRIAGFKG